MQNIEQEAAPRIKSDVDYDTERRLARIDLAAAFRLAVLNELHEGIENHFSLVVPGRSDRFYLNPFGYHWSEITASNLLEVTHDGRVASGEGVAEISAVSIHGPIHRILPNAKCILHTHMPYATAITLLDDMTIEMTNQQAMLFMHGKVAYDYDYRGAASGVEEGERMAEIMGDKSILMLSNHGVVVTGRSVAEAFHTLYFVERIARAQLFSMWTGKPRKWLPQEMLEETKSHEYIPIENDDRSLGEHHFAALKRILDRQGIDYAN